MNKLFTEDIEMIIYQEAIEEALEDQRRSDGWAIFRRLRVNHAVIARVTEIWQKRRRPISSIGWKKAANEDDNNISVDLKSNQAYSIRSPSKQSSIKTTQT